MSSVCISNCINDARDPRVPVRATYVNLYKWPESDAEFVKSMRRANVRRAASPSHILHGRHPSVVDSISCRQLYLRSYPFSREADGGGDRDRDDLGRRCLSFGCTRGGASDNYGGASDGDGGGKRRRRREEKKKKRGGGGGGGGGGGERKKSCVMLRRAKEVSCDALLRLFHRLLSCSATVDVAVQK